MLTISGIPASVLACSSKFAIWRKAGLARVRAKGTRLGRPELGEELRCQIRDLAATGASAYRIGKALGIDIKTAAKYAA
jgi:hypothetical protein